MQTITAIERITTRIRPVPQLPAKPVPEVLTTHAAECPQCGRETRVGLGAAGTVYGGCPHFAGIEQRGTVVTVEFKRAAA